MCLCVCPSLFLHAWLVHYHVHIAEVMLGLVTAAARCLWKNGLEKVVCASLSVMGNGGNCQAPRERERIRASP